MRRSRRGCVPTADGAEVRLDAPALPAPGQACVFYDGERVLGGGFIRRPAALTVDVPRRGAVCPRPSAMGWRRSSAVEQGNHNPLVGGSNPPAATIRSSIFKELWGRLPFRGGNNMLA